MPLVPNESNNFVAPVISRNTTIFIVGMPRSGTTLTEQIIASHPDIYGAGELPNLQTITQRDIAPLPQSLHLLDQNRLSAWGMGHGICERKKTRPKLHSHYRQDAMPYNFIAVGLIHLMLPNAKIIHIRGLGAGYRNESQAPLGVLRTTMGSSLLGLPSKQKRSTHCQFRSSSPANLPFIARTRVAL